MRKILVVLFCLPGYISVCFSQNEEMNTDKLNGIFKGKGEVYFRFDMAEKSDIHRVTKIISVANVKGNAVYAYANRKEFDKFLQTGMRYEVLKSPGELALPEWTKDIPKSGPLTWDYYPTYSAYETLMTQFQTSHPDLCHLETIATLPSGRKLLAVKISDNVNVKEAEPEFLYTSSIHGDELTGAIMMLHLIDYLLSGYGINPEITNLVDHAEIWINPLANPDGTYHGGNNTVTGAIRYNANFVDLNRNYPDPQDGPHPDGNAWQPETVAFMNFAANHNFVMSANFHGGAELVNYPWDTWAQLHADDSWWQFVSREFADTIHAHAPAGFFNDYQNGITNGYAWYEVDGGRQDYMNYFRHDRECTIELTNTMTPPASMLLTYWNYFNRSLINYIKESIYGIGGIVTDSITGQPLRAKVYIAGHDFDSSNVYSSAVNGDYYRPIYGGTYSLTYSASGYYSKTIPAVTVTTQGQVLLNVQLRPLSTGLQGESELRSFSVFPDPTAGWIRIRCESTLPGNPCLRITNLAGEELLIKTVTAGNLCDGIDLDLSSYPKGIYLVKLVTAGGSSVRKVVLM